MHGTTRKRPSATTAGATVTVDPSAVVWIEPGRALVLRGTPDGETDRFELPLPAGHAQTPPALAEVAHRIGSVRRVLVLGSDELRTALEREIVAIGHQPETIRDEPLAAAPDEAGLAARLHQLR